MLAESSLVRPPSVPAVEHLVDYLERLEDAVDAIRGGSRVARDGLATVLHVLVSDLIPSACTELGIEEPSISVWSDSDLIEQYEGRPVAFAFRAAAPDAGLSVAPVSQGWTQPCLRWADPSVNPQQSFSIAELAMMVRHKYGSHVDRNPQEWLRRLRIYPVAGSDAVTYLLWSHAEVLLEACTHHFAASGIDVAPWSRPSPYLDGLAVSEGFAVVDGAGVDLICRVSSDRWQSGNGRPVFGGVFDRRPFLLCLNPEGQMESVVGAPGSALEALERACRRESTLNRAARRAARRAGGSART